MIPIRGKTQDLLLLPLLRFPPDVPSTSLGQYHIHLASETPVSRATVRQSEPFDQV